MPHLEMGDGPPLLLLHGFLGCAEDWHAVMPGLADARRAIALDLPGHGPEPEPLLDFEQTVRWLLDRMDRLGVDRFDLVGYSMGGRLACGLLAAAPERITRLALISANPGLAPEEQAARRVADEKLARRIEADLPGFLEVWYRLPLFGGLRRHPDYAAMIARRRRGRPTALADALRALGPGCHRSYWPVIATSDVPLCYLVGTGDDKYVDLGQRLAEERETRLELIEDAAHALPIERPGRLVELLGEWLANQSG